MNSFVCFGFAFCLSASSTLMGLPLVIPRTFSSSRLCMAMAFFSSYVRLPGISAIISFIRLVKASTASCAPVWASAIYGCLSENSLASLPGLFSSPSCGLSAGSKSGRGVGSSSVDEREHLQFQRSPGRWLFQNGSSMGRIVPQNRRWSAPGCREVDGIHFRLGSTSFSRSNCRQLAAWCARIIAVSYSVSSHW